MSAPDYHIKSLTAALVRISQSPVLPRALEHLQAGATAIDARLGETVLREIPAFTESRNPKILPELAEHVPLHTQQILKLLTGAPVGEFDFVIAHARRRAEQHFPLETTLHAYRCGHKVYLGWLRDAILTASSSAEHAQHDMVAIADFALEYTDAISSVFASAYLSQTRLLASVAVDRRTELINILLEGSDESDRRVTAILREAGFLDRRQSFCIALAQSVDPQEMLNPSRARRLANAVDAVFGTTSARRLVDVRDNKVVVIYSDLHRSSGWTAPQSGVLARFLTCLNLVGVAALIGVGSEVRATSQIPRAFSEARLALEFASTKKRVLSIAEISMVDIVLRLAGERLPQALPAWASDFYQADHRSRQALGNTLRAYASADMNIQQAAAALAIHPNTIYSRFQRIHHITGLDPRSFAALVDLLVVCQCRDRSAFLA